jgi:hypothetical protein
MNIKRIYPFLLSGFLLIIMVLPAAAHDGDNHAGFSLSGKLAILITFSLVFLTLLVIWFKVGKGLRLSQYSIIGLAVATAVIHLLEGINSLLLALNGVGYLALLAALYAPKPDVLIKFHKQLYWGVIGYTMLTIILFFMIHTWGMEADAFDKLGLGTKVIELLLVGLMYVELMTTGRQPFSQSLVEPNFDSGQAR